MKEATIMKWGKSGEKDGVMNARVQYGLSKGAQCKSQRESFSEAIPKNPCHDVDNAAVMIRTGDRQILTVDSFVCEESMTLLTEGCGRRV